MEIEKVTFYPRLITEKRSTPVPNPTEEDEIFVNGIFHFNISALLEWLESNPQPVVKMLVGCWVTDEYKIPEFVEAADLDRPIVIAEIEPDYRDFFPDFPETHWGARGYVCIDGYHRIEKARNLGMSTLPAIVLRMEQHVPFIYKGCDEYVKYWNQKLIERIEDSC